jgi:nucleoside phosphorylase
VRRVLASFPFVRFGLLVGTAAGYPKPDQGKDIRLGDVVIGRTDESGGLVQYNLEAIKRHESRGPADVLHKAPNLLISTLDKLHSDYYAKKTSIRKIIEYHGKDRLFSPNYPHTGETSCDKCDPDKEILRGSRGWKGAHIFYGTIAAGGTVVRDTATRDLIENHIGDDCICFDRGSVDLMSDFPCLVIRGISRYADSHLNSEKWESHAMANASAYTKLFLRRLAAPQVRNLRKVVNVRGLKGELITSKSSTTPSFRSDR